MTNVFIERRLDLKKGGEVSVRFLRPEPDIEGDWHCDIELEWPDRRQALRIFGIDAIQALLLAMQGARCELVSSPESAAGELTWLGEREFGLPVMAAPACPKNGHPEKVE
ncbi:MULTISPECIES: DUF6968 family protein [Pseudomonas]|jgi:hypothetical protein|uniref:DUF6968 family protein n=1 Tax=Pseudomonas TaxID=286 RepID=UPI00099B3E46|nr:MULTISPECIES: hypothetical protein [Pseudomonas]MCK3838831.1 hypothetical protein [Pseudomonas sp. NCIMB 10586]OPA97784.1 hypothetical protein BFW89_27400 [Pseudomonas synxantha]VCU67902.1 hypothetical protein [Pseudomonas synxantha]